MPEFRHFFVIGLLTPLLANATPPPYPLDRPALTVHRHGEDSLKLSLQDLQRLPLHSISLRDKSGHVAQWSGVRLDDVLSHAGAHNYTMVHASALNDYSVLIPRDDIQRYQPLVAYQRDGAYVAIRDNGPLQLVYPFDDHPKLHTQIYYNRAIWQLSEIRAE